MLGHLEPVARREGMFCGWRGLPIEAVGPVSAAFARHSHGSSIHDLGDQRRVHPRRRNRSHAQAPKGTGIRSDDNERRSTVCNVLIVGAGPSGWVTARQF
jgi:hypothetical protein